MALPTRILRRYSIKAAITAAFFVIVYCIIQFYRHSHEESTYLAPRPTFVTPIIQDAQKNGAAADKDKLTAGHGEMFRSSNVENKQGEDMNSPVERGNDPENAVRLGHIDTPIESQIKTNVKYPGKKKGDSSPCLSVHIFYYPWYNNLKIDQHYAHWNHKVLPHWDKNVDKLHKKGAHSPPNDIGSDFYPELGPYSSRDPEVIREHLAQISGAGIGVIVVSYYPVGHADDNGKPWDDIYLMLLDQAVGFNVKVTFHIEPYKDRNEKTVRDDIVHIIDTYGSHEGFYRHKYKDSVLVPLFYVYDSYHTKPEDWARILSVQGPNTIRGTKYDAIMIALAVEMVHYRYLTVGGFNGLYTYFATNGFTYGSSWQHWMELSKTAKDSKSLFIPSVGPGYVDTSIRPWNVENTRERVGGEYYRNSWDNALSASPDLISITSFNEWHEGTQIEKAVPKVTNARTYLDYKPFSPSYYLDLTDHYVNKFGKCQSKL